MSGKNGMLEMIGQKNQMMTMMDKKTPMQGHGGAMYKPEKKG